MTDRRFTGLDCSEIEPWYITGIRTWIVMMTAMRRGVPGVKVCKAWADRMDVRLQREPPAFIYAYYRDWNRMIEAECSR